MAFVPKKFDSGKVAEHGVSASATITKGYVAKWDSGYISAGASGDNEVDFVSLQTVTDATAVDGSTKVLLLPVDDTVRFYATCATTPVQETHVGNDYDLASASTLDLTATTDKVFHIDAIVDASNKIVEGHFNKPAIA